MDTTIGTLPDETEIPVGGVSKYTVSEVRTNKEYEMDKFKWMYFTFNVVMLGFKIKY